MAFYTQLCLLVTLSAVTADLSSYIPQLTNSPIPGRVTATTLALDTPQCLFNQSSTNTVWLIVANSTVAAQLNNTSLAIPVPYSPLISQGYYRTLGKAENTFPCLNSAQYIRVGDDTACSDPSNCNGPLPSPGSYQVKFIVLNSAGMLSDQTSWSGVISLHQGKSSSIIDTWPGGRSGAMIVITSILSILLAAFLACLIGVFIVGRKGTGKPISKTVETTEKPVKTQEIDLKDYRMHHAQPESTIYDQPIA
ncbi:uroplakin-3b [Pseudophryne corroboree]|uniref:uroplakin-3b n=1 Tax=Pseudophryne corroboree TaxID=495146 RepID=UPI0030813863